MNNNIINKSLKHAYALFPEVYHKSQNWSRRIIHFCFIYNKNKLLSIGHNNIAKENGSMMKLARKFNVSHFQKYPYSHAEIDAIRKLWGKYHIDHNLKFVVLRLNKDGKILQSKPCKNCSIVLNALDVHKIWWSNDQESFNYGL